MKKNIALKGIPKSMRVTTESSFAVTIYHFLKSNPNAIRHGKSI